MRILEKEWGNKPKSGDLGRGKLPSRRSTRKVTGTLISQDKKKRNSLPVIGTCLWWIKVRWIDDRLGLSAWCYSLCSHLTQHPSSSAYLYVSSLVQLVAFIFNVVKLNALFWSPDENWLPKNIKFGYNIIPKQFFKDNKYI